MYIKLKKIAAILLLCCYLIPAMGLSVKQHYCGGKLASVSIVFFDKPSCPCGKKPMKKDCCKDKTVVLKLKDNQNLAKSIVPNFSQSFKLLIGIFPEYEYHFEGVAVKRHLHFAHPPPLQKSEALYLRNQVFLI